MITSVQPLKPLHTHTHTHTHTQTHAHWPNSTSRHKILLLRSLLSNILYVSFLKMSVLQHIAVAARAVSQWRSILSFPLLGGIPRCGRETRPAASSHRVEGCGIKYRVSPQTRESNRQTSLCKSSYPSGKQGAAHRINTPQLERRKL